MTQRFGFSLIALAAIAFCAATADTASAWHRLRNGGSEGGNGSAGGNGSNGGGSWGSNGSNGSFGGLFARRRNGSWGSNGSHGSNGGNGSCGSHGGTYNGNHDDNGDDDDKEGEAANHQASASPQRDVRFYGPREYSGGQIRQPAPGAPALNQGEQQPALTAPQNPQPGATQPQGALGNPSAQPAPLDPSFRPATAGEAAKP